MDSRRNRRGYVSGGLSPAQVKALSPEVRAARARYLADSGAQLDSMFREQGVTEYIDDGKRVVSLDAMLEAGYQVGEDGTVYPPSPDYEFERNPLSDWEDA